MSPRTTHLTNDGRLRSPHGSFGQCIKALREKAGLTQVQLAKKLDRSQSTIVGYETDRILPSRKIINMMALEFSVPVDYLLGQKRSLFL